MSTDFTEKDLKKSRQQSEASAVQIHYRLVSEITNRNGKMPIKPLMSRFSKNRF